jgi:hypothetical protein
MPAYRVFQLVDGRLKVIAEFPDEASAAERAQLWRAGGDVEIWLGDKKIASHPAFPKPDWDVFSQL